jgi:hypothetical protein
MPHWKRCNCLRTPHSRGRHPLQRVYDKGRKDHCFHGVQAQLPNRERDSSSVHQGLQCEVGPQTCEKLVVLKIPVKKMFNVDRIIMNKGRCLLYVVQEPSLFLPNQRRSLPVPPFLVHDPQ